MDIYDIWTPTCLGAKISLRQNLLMPKPLDDKTSRRQNVKDASLRWAFPNISLQLPVRVSEENVVP